MNDMTESNQSEQELRESARRLDLALEATDTGVWEWNMQTDEVVWSETLEQLLGLEPGSFDGTYEAFEKYLHPDDAAELNQAVEQAIEDGSFSAEFRMIREDGEQIWVSGRAEYFSEDGPERMLGTTTDITELKQRERELQRQNERLAEFASVVSHDLRNPLSVAKGRIELAKESRDWSELDAVSAAHDRMQTLIEDMLALANAGEDVGETEAVELRALVEACWRNVETGSATIDVEMDATFQADENRFKQLLENVFRNAIEHGGTGVEITVGGLSNGFFVEDDGPGIPERERDKVLSPGYSTREGGSGFGLSIVRDIANAHGWQITVTEGSDGGARFEFTGIERV